MTKEQLIELIQKQIPDGDLITFRCKGVDGSDRYFNLSYIDDSTNVGLWELRLREITDEESPFKHSIDDAAMWRDSGKLEAKVNWQN